MVRRKAVLERYRNSVVAASHTVQINDGLLQAGTRIYHSQSRYIGAAAAVCLGVCVGVHAHPGLFLVGTSSEPRPPNAECSKHTCTRRTQPRPCASRAQQTRRSTPPATQTCDCDLRASLEQWLALRPAV
eukprot:3552252-Prymnesium_polylepis.1